MKLNITQPGDTGPLKISGTLDIYTVDTLRDVLAEHVKQQTALLLDLSEVDGCDVAGLQLLCSAHKSAEASRAPFAVTALSQAVVESCAALGLLTEQFQAGAV